MLRKGYQSIAMGYNAKTTSNGETAVGIVVSPAGDFAGNANFAISNPRMNSNAVITINLSNIAAGAESLYSGHFYVTINEF